MRHNKRTKRFGRTTSHRTAMWRNMTTSLFRHERIQTTLPKAKELRRVAERLITKAKRVTRDEVESASGKDQQRLSAQRLHNIRQAAVTVQDREVLRRLFDVYGERYKERAGGYTRIYRLGPRPGDAAEMALIELVDADPEEGREEPAKKKKRKKKKKR